jgi:hypothetical protein
MNYAQFRGGTQFFQMQTKKPATFAVAGLKVRRRLAFSATQSADQERRTTREQSNR